jgi:hypothetical protein
VGRDHEDITGLYPGVCPGEEGLAVTRDRDHLRPPPADPLAPEQWDQVAAWFDRREFQRKLHWRQHPSFHAFVFFLRWHGARPSEAAALTWDNVDLHQGIAYVRHSFHYGAVGEPKTEAARRSIELHPEMLTILRALRPLRPEPGAPLFPNLDGRRITPKTFWGTWKRCLQDCRIRHRGIYALKDTFVTHTLAMAEESGAVERLTAWLVRQTGVRLDTLKRHYERWWPRDREAIRATYALLDLPSGQIATQLPPRSPKTLITPRTGSGRRPRPAPRSPSPRGAACPLRGTWPRSGAARSRRRPSPRRG